MERNKTMKNKHITIVALAAAALATSCASEDIAEPLKQNQGEPKTVTLTASVNEAQTRVGMTKDTDATKASFYWHENDEISVMTFYDATNHPNAKFTTTVKTGEKSAQFTGEMTGESNVQYALYPYNEKHAFDGDATNSYLTYYLPAEYTYTTVGSNIFSKDGTYPSNPTNMPMLGTIADRKISFKCLGGLAVIRIDQMPAASGTLTVTADQQLSGSFMVNESDIPPKMTTTTTDTDSEKQVTFTFSGASDGGVGVFYLPLAPGDYTNLTIKISDSNGENTQTIPYGSLTVNRANVTAIPLSADSEGNLRHIVDNGNGSYTINGHEFIDLGLSILWATMNVGATKAEDIGNYYAWGEVKPKDSYTENNYTCSEVTLDNDHDAAYVNWGSSCRMPTTEEFAELNNSENCKWSSSWNYTGRTITSKKQGYDSNSIFLPYTGYYEGENRTDYSGTHDGSSGYYWSRSGSASNASSFYFYFTNVNQYTCSSSYTYRGRPIRPVAEKPTTTE